jgi:hypothetical protein
MAAASDLMEESKDYCQNSAPRSRCEEPPRFGQKEGNLLDSSKFFRPAVRGAAALDVDLLSMGRAPSPSRRLVLIEEVHSETVELMQGLAEQTSYPQL